MDWNQFYAFSVRLSNKYKLIQERSKMKTFKEHIIERNYKGEYKNYHSRDEQKKRRAGRNKARRMLKNVKGIEGKDVHHKDNNPLNNDKSNYIFSGYLAHMCHADNSL